MGEAGLARATANLAFASIARAAPRVGARQVPCPIGQHRNVLRDVGRRRFEVRRQIPRVPEAETGKGLLANPILRKSPFRFSTRVVPELRIAFSWFRGIVIRVSSPGMSL